MPENHDEVFMLILNFSHPLTAEQREQIEALTDEPIAEVRQIAAQVDLSRPLAPQVAEMAEAAGLSPEEWQTRPLLVVPPALNFSAVTLLAHLHGRMGYFPPVVTLRRVPEALPPRFAVAEILNLQAVREQARQQRT